MNEPMRYQGETFYQAGVRQRRGHHPPGRAQPRLGMPYIACGMVIVGLAVHFGMGLVGFLRRVLVNGYGIAPVFAAAPRPACMWGCRAAIPPAGRAAALRGAGAIPVMAGGRTKPFEAGPITLMLISGRQVFYDDQTGALGHPMDAGRHDERQAAEPGRYDERGIPHRERPGA